MRNKKHIFLVMSLAILSALSVRAVEQIVAPYQLGFEESDTIELGNWVFNPGAQSAKCAEQWHVGTATYNSGHQSLYITGDSGVSYDFGAQPNLQYAYRDFTIPSGGYDISFDWSCRGAKGTTALYAAVSLVSSVQRDMNALSTSAAMPKTIQQWVTGASGTGELSGEAGWSNASIHFKSNGAATYRLFFVWRNGNTDTTLVSPLGACVDNIQITSDRCKKPNWLRAETGCDTVKLQWDGSSTQYCIEYRRRGAKRWSVTTGIENDHYILEGLDEGMYDFRVRGVCPPDTSAYTYLNGKVVFCPDKHCINYVTLTDSLNVECTYGTFKDPYQNAGVIDRGYNEKLSRHTTVWEPGLYDIRTGNQLPLIPDGELASVRLGNWDSGTQGEAITYLYQVDLEKAAILLLKYAVVLEDPDHGSNDNPRFTMEILDENGELISPTCGAANFYADAKRQDPTWHLHGSTTWKEWTTIGLNLAEVGVQDGDVLRIRLTTRDCNWGAHFGYAYFTLGCAAAQLLGTSCGDEAQLSVSAPNGFDYTWYNEQDEVVSTTQELSVESWDISTYRCHLSYKENAECGFDLETRIRPRFPIAEFKYQYEPSDCQNKVRFANMSHIITKTGGVVEHHRDEACDEYEWDFGTGVISSDRNPVVVFPQDGGTFNVTLTSSISDGVCRNDTTISITLPKIGNTNDTIEKTICQGSYEVFGKYYAGEEGFYSLENKSKAGCDSVTVLNLHVKPVYNTQLPDTTICGEATLVEDGKTYMHRESGKFVRFYRDAYGCDSTLWRNVTVLDSIKPIVTVQEMTDANSGTIYIDGDGFDYYTVNDGEPQPWSTEMAVTGLNGGTYTIVFYNDFGCSFSDQYSVSSCLVNHVYQRWDNVLSLKDAAAAGVDTTDHKFTDFQWYENDVAIEGANRSYLYLPNGLNPSDTYTLEMTRVSTGERVNTCPFLPKQAPERRKITIYPSPVTTGGTMNLDTEEDGSIAIYSLLGERVYKGQLSEGKNQLTAPYMAGIYTVHVECGDQVMSCQISVVE